VDPTWTELSVPTGGAEGNSVGLRSRNGSPVSTTRFAVVPSTSTGVVMTPDTRVKATSSAIDAVGSGVTFCPEGDDDEEQPARTKRSAVSVR
jgi:hypothetical protein